MRSTFGGEMPVNMITRIKCSPPHGVYFAVLGLTLFGFGVWWLIERDPVQMQNIAGLIAATALLSAAIWFIGMFLPYKNCEYEIMENEIRVLRSGKLTRVIPFSSVANTRRRGRALIVSLTTGSQIYPYPQEASELIEQRIASNKPALDNP